MPDDLLFLHGSHNPRCIATVDKRFDYHTLQFMARGGVELFYDDERWEMRGRWMWPCMPGPWVRFHDWPRGSPWEHRYIAFTGPLVTRWASDGLLLARPEPVSAADARGLAPRFDELIASATQPGRWARLRGINLLERILLDRAETRDAQTPQRPRWLDAVTTAISRFNADEPDYAALARAHGLSLTTLRRHFRALTGSSLHEYRLDARAAAARQLLGDTDLPLKQIADELGYRDVFFFSRQFKQRVGVAPGEYRRSRQA